MYYRYVVRYWRSGSLYEEGFVNGIDYLYDDKKDKESLNKATDLQLLMEKLPAPKIDMKSTYECWFTERGNRKFRKLAHGFRDFVEERGYLFLYLQTKYFPKDIIVYEDPYQVVIDRSKVKEGFYS